MKNNILQFFGILFLFGCMANSPSVVGNESSLPNKPTFEETFGSTPIQNKIYVSDIKTIWAAKTGWKMSNPAIDLASGESINFSFDKMGSDLGDYYYTIIHCDAEWKKSDLIQSQYMSGFFQDFIQNFKFSFNTYENFVHYEVSVPNKNMGIKLTGNYIFKVFRDNDPEQIVFTKRFIVYENKIITRAKINRPSIVQERNYKQELDFELDLQNLMVPDIHRDIKVVLQQNNRWDNAIFGLKPLFVRGKQLIYDYNNGSNMFDGGNEYRFLDTRNMRFRGQKVQQIVLQNRETNVYLFPEEKRRFTNYLFYEDIDGKFYIRNQFGINQGTEADYIYTHFALNYPNEITEGDLYVFGGMSDNEFREEFKMTYNPIAKQYETKVLLKQGYYDYLYMLKRKHDAKGDITFIEGDHFETENMYAITTYFSDPICNCDKIIGYQTFKSNTAQ